MSKLFFILLITMYGLNLFGQQATPEFTRFKYPIYPGERSATSVIDVSKGNFTDLKVYLYYSSNKSKVEAGNCSYATAKTSKSSNRLTCEFIFPHKDYPTPNYGNIDLTASQINSINTANWSAPPIPSTDKDPEIYNSKEVFYQWVCKYKSNGRQQTLKSDVKSFQMPRLLIIAYAGDSYAAGEGAPDGSSEKWIDDKCHRSEKSGGMRAIKKLISEHPELGIRYINVTCSGAEIGDMTTADVRTGWFGTADWSRKAQLLQIEEKLKKNNRNVVDIFLMSIGGNNAGFGPIGTSTFIAGTSNLSEVKSTVRNALQSLESGYVGLDKSIRGWGNFDVGRIVIMNYPDPTHLNSSTFCNPDIGGTNPFDCWGVVEKRISKVDFEYIYNNIVIDLNKEIKKAAEKNDWDLVDISSKARNNGLCDCESPYFNTIGQSMFVQGDIQGTLHPNATGYKKIYQDEVCKQLLKSIDKWHDELKDEAIDEAKKKAKEKLKQKRLELAKKQTNIQMISAEKSIKVFPNIVQVKGVKPKLDLEDETPSKDKELGNDD
ncbi:MAG: GDSL-type esterase/lipase family protein [Agriterribacter sp.]